jgi:cation diffusion facilitator CzcD-associated flavoprotein CzcO
MQKAAVKRVGVIGSGAAGLQVAKCMIASGFDCIVIEKAPKVGGLWQSNYRSVDLRPISLNKMHPSVSNDLNRGLTST